MNEMSIQADLKAVTRHKTATVSMVEQLGKFSKQCGDPLRLAVTTFEKQI